VSPDFKQIAYFFSENNSNIGNSTHGLKVYNLDTEEVKIVIPIIKSRNELFSGIYGSLL
jgi:hypothetical protein